VSELFLSFLQIKMFGLNICCTITPLDIYKTMSELAADQHDQKTKLVVNVYK